MKKLKIKLGDNRGYYVTVETAPTNLHRVFDDHDADVIERMMQCMVPQCNQINQRVNGVEYSISIS